MRFGSRGIVLALAASLLTIPLTGCQTEVLRVRLPGFANGNVDGLWFWRLENRVYKRVCRINLSNTYVSGGREVVDYSQYCVDGRHSSTPWQAVVERLPSNPKTVTLAFVFRRSATKKAAHRASAFNASGESTLSSSVLLL